MAKTECLCDRCVALCCRYFALAIDTPETPAEYDDIRWYLAHESVHVFIEDGDWYLAVQTRCKFLQDDNKCGIYADRPKICRNYSTKNCDFHIGAYEFEQYFTEPEQLEAYAQATLGERYRRYIMRQRKKNLGSNGAGCGVREVMSHRVYPTIKGHPSLHTEHALHHTRPKPAVRAHLSRRRSNG